MSAQTSSFRGYLDQVLRQWRKTLLLQGLSLTVAAGGLLVGVSLAADYLIGLGMAARMILLLLFVAGTGLAAFRFLIRPLRQVPDDLQVARYVEEHHPELNDGFVSAVEFEGKPLSGPQQTLLSRLIAQISPQTRQIDFRRLVDHKRLHRAEGLAVLAIAVLAVLAMQDIDLFGRSVLRLAAPWSRPGPLLATEISVAPGDARLPRGGSQRITVRLEGRLAAHVRLFSRQKGAEEWYGVDMLETETSGTFTHDMTDIGEETEYYADVDRAVSPTYTLTVFDPPQVERIDATYEYPGYTGLEPNTEEDKGDITAPVGTAVRLTITASKPVTTGALKFSNGTTLTLAVDDRTLKGSLTVQEDLSYTVHLVDTDGLANLNPVEYFIRALPDQGPHVAIVQPGRDTRVSPIEEVLIRAEAEDDFGLASFTLTYSVNGGKDRTIDLGSDPQSRTVWAGEHTLYLEELSVKPGDFISYYATAADRRRAANQTSTDIYFLEVKPFEETYRQGSGGGGGMGEGVAGLQPGRLSQEQKEVIAATWRVKREESRVPKEQTRDDLNAIAKAQDGIRERAEESLSVLQFQGGMEEEVMKMAELLEKAIDPMERASGQLRDGSADGALPPEQEALLYLMRVDALVREYMVTMTNSMSSDAPLDFSDTSELELKRDENRYETPDKVSQAQQQNQTIDGSLQRVRELAQRQQQLNNQMRQLANNPRQSETERRRELDRLTREQTQLRQQAEQLARQLAQMPNSQQPSRDMNQSLREATNGLRQSSEEMGQSAQQLQRNNPQNAAGQGSRALQRLEDATQQLQRAQGQSLEQLTRNAVQRADQLAARQQQIARAVDELKKEQDRDYAGVKARIDALDGGRGGLTEEDKDRRVDAFVRKRLRELGDGKDHTRQELARLKSDLEYLTERARREQPQTAQAAEEAAETIGSGLNQKIDRSKNLLEPGSLDRSARTEKELAEDLKTLAEQVRAAQKNLIMPDQDQLTRAQDTMQDAMSRWQNIQRQMDRLQRGVPPSGSLRQLSQDYQQQLQQLRDLADQMQGNGRSSQPLRDALNRATALGNEPWKIDRSDWNELHQGVAQALQDVHRALGDQLQNLVQREKLHSARDEDVPPEYRDLVNRYYEKLSKDAQQ